MLVLSRKVGEQIVIDGDVRVTVVAVKGNTVRLGVTAPAAVLVDRAEVHERRQQAGRTDPPLPVPSVSEGDLHYATRTTG